MKDFFERQHKVLTVLNNELMGYYLRHGKGKPSLSPEDVPPDERRRIATLLNRFYRVTSMMPGGRRSM